MGHIWLFVWWTVFGLTHSLFAGDNVKAFIRTVARRHYKYYRLVYSVFATFMLTGILYLNFTLDTVALWHPPLIEQVLCGVTGTVGAIVMMICIRKYFFDLSGISVFFKQRAEEGLKVNGMNRYVRHPLYSGTLLFVLSWFLWQPSLSNLISCLCIFAYTIIGTRVEEQRLVRTFGNEYRTYAAKVPMLIPKIL